MAIKAGLIILSAMAAWACTEPSLTGAMPPQTKLTVIDAPDAMSGTFLKSINNNGSVLGTFIDIHLAAHYFQTSYGFYKTFGFSGDQQSVTFSASWNKQGQIVGAYYDPRGGFHGFLLDHDHRLILDFPNAADTYATSINDKGRIVGIYSDRAGMRHAFLWTSGKYVSIDPQGVTDIHMRNVVINNLGHVAATYEDKSGKHTYLSIKSVAFPLRTMNAQARFVVAGLNDHDEIVGNCAGDAPQSSAPCYLWSHGVYRSLTTVSTSRSVPTRSPFTTCPLASRPI